MIVRFQIDPIEQGQYEYRVTYEGEELYADAGLNSIEECIVAATDGLGGDAVGAEIAFQDIISGTYPLATLAFASAHIAEHALNTTTAIQEVNL